MAAKRQPKIRVQLRKNRGTSARQNDFTRSHQAGETPDDTPASERVSHKGGLTRKRTIIADATGGRAVDESVCRAGRVLRAIGATQCLVQDDTTRQSLTCTIRRMLRTMASDERTAVVAGDRVLYQPMENQQGVIERVEPRQSVLTRKHQYREHVLVANVTQVLIVASLGEPPLKPPLIDRFLLSAAKGNVAAAICLNKADLVDLVDLQPLIALYSRLGYPVVPTSPKTGVGMERLRQLLRGQQTVFTGQSGVGKSTLLNAIQPSLGLRTGAISEVTQKGRHTTRYAQLLELDAGGWVVDTPGIRQLDLWDVDKGEVEGFFREFRPIVPYCKFPNCLHLDESACAIRQAVDDGFISRQRYESYLRMVVGDD